MGRPVIYLDANVVIRLVEGDAATRRAAGRATVGVAARSVVVVTVELL